ncbi:MAG: DUF2244 domain-containing protein [Burkholderiaceae bacterium]
MRAAYNPCVETNPLRIVAGSSRTAPVRMQYRWSYAADQHMHEWVLKRNCALTPVQLAMWFGSLAAVSLLLALLFASMGAWLTIPFALVEITALAWAFVWWARHATDYERIVVCDGLLSVEKSSGERLRRIECRPAWVRVEYGGARCGPIRIVSSCEAIEIGGLVPDDRRAALARELRGAFASQHAGGSARG